MNDEILILNEYPIGWGWLKDVPLKDWECPIMISKYWTSLGYPVNPIYYYINCTYYIYFVYLHKRNKNIILTDLEQVTNTLTL